MLIPLARPAHAPGALGTRPGLLISLSGEELSLTAPRLYMQCADLQVFLDGLSDLAGGIEAIRYAQALTRAAAQRSSSTTYLSNSQLSCTFHGQ